MEDIYSNTPLEKDGLLANVEVSEKNTILDLGDDYFTNGRPHPMIDPRLRLERIKKEALDRETAVILLDVVLGYGSNEDMAGEVATNIEKINKELKAEGRTVSYVASVCGTDEDIQNRSEQIEKLQNAGVLVMPSNAQAVRLAILIAARGEGCCELVGGAKNE
jgi:FdrA protein